MKLSEYLATLTRQTNMLDEISYRENASQVVPVEMHLKLVSIDEMHLKLVSIDESPKKLLQNALKLLKTHPDSPFHELMAVEFLLENIIFLPKIKEKLNEIKTEIAQTIQNLYYLLEKPHPETASSGYNERRRAQEKYIKEAIMADRGRGEKDDPLMLLALQYCLKNMDDDTFTYLTKDLEISDQAVTRRSSLANLQAILYSYACDGQPDPKYLAALATLEFYRVATTHRTEEKHAAKNQRFYQEIIRPIDNNPAETPMLNKTDSTPVISPPRPRFSNKSSSVLSEDGKRVHDEPTPLSIQTVSAISMVFHFSASLPQSSIDLLARIQLSVSASTQAVNKDERESLLISSDERSIQSFGPRITGDSLRESEHRVPDSPYATEQSARSSPLLEYETDGPYGSPFLSSKSHQGTSDTAGVNSSGTQPPLSVIVAGLVDGSSRVTTTTSDVGAWRSVPSAPSSDSDGRFSPVKTAGLSPVPRAHAVENSYQVPPSGNCCYSSIIVALMHGFFSGSIVQGSHTAGALNVESGFFHKIQARTEKNLGNTVTEKFQFLLEQYKNRELELLENTMVPALREVIAEYALALNYDSEACKQLRYAIDFMLIHDGVRAELAETQPTRQPRADNVSSEDFIIYFNNVKNSPALDLEGGIVEFLAVKQIYSVTITATSCLFFCQTLNDEPRLDIRQTRSGGHYEVHVERKTALNAVVSNFCDSVMRSYTSQKRKQPTKDFPHSVLKTPTRLSFISDIFSSGVTQRSSASRQLSTGSTRSVTSRLSVEGSVSVRQESKSDNFVNFKTEITQYYAALDNRQDNLKALVSIVTSLSAPGKGIVVYAPVATAKFEKGYQCMDDIYAHLYILLYSIVFATSTTAALTNRQISLNAVKAKKDAATILEWLSNCQDDKLVSALIEVHVRMLNKECLPEDTSVVKMVSWRDESRCNLCEKLYLDNPSPQIDATVLTILRVLPFRWSSLYTNRADETAGHIIEKRRHYEVITAYALQDILNDSLRDPLSIEAQWLTLKAIADYNKVRAYQKSDPKSRLLAESPFFNAIRLLAVTYPLASTNASAQIREQELCQHLYERAVPSLFIYEGELLRQQKLLKEELVVLVLEVENGIQPVSICSLTFPVVRKLFNSDEKNTESVGSNSPGEAVSISYWSILDEKHFTKEGVGTLARLTEDEIKFILNDFDRKCERASDDEKNKLSQLLKKAFCEMQQIFQNPNNHQRTSFSMFSFGRRESPPINFDSFINCIAPKESLPPYAFAQYCVYQSKRIENREIVCLLRHEDHFIRKHLLSLYDENNRQALNLIKVSETAEPLGDYVAPLSEPTATSAIGMIYPALDLEISALEAKGNNVTLKEVKPYYDMIFSKTLRRLEETFFPSDNLKEGRGTISQRIENLHRIATQQSTLKYSKK